MSAEGTRFSLYDSKKVNLSVVAIKSTVLGFLLAVNCTVIILAFLNVIYVPSTIIKINGYVSFVCIFHFLEFITTAVFNNSNVDDDSFILNDWDLHAINVISILEFLMKSWFTSFSFTKMGLVLILLSQIIRTLAMCTAGESFNHYIQKERHNDHKLVTNGIYSIMRHPSYFGFFWWFIGLQLYFGNIITLTLGTFKLWNFFNKRIEFEENYLTTFFGKDYLSYKSQTGTGIPFIT
ncbi:uncharacterized protein PRCAT00001047001 [Priceomyces carsonii]|uniref:uncharacterized protein n=1 Tax=Priceomyces carsonii TaxID=28549 RepID=UPI002ED89F6C|nr:unnamed protein product [Priceomyces carsonii]